MKRQGINPLQFSAIAILAALLPTLTIATEPKPPLPAASTINTALPVHQQKKLHPELSDPVLGDQAEIVEWAWSPQYARRFGLQPQADGLKDGPLWLIGVKVQREQSGKWQRYTCHVIGVMDNKLPIITPPGDVYMAYPLRINGLPGGARPGSPDMKHEVSREALRAYTPAQKSPHRENKSELKKKKPIPGITTNYRAYQRKMQADLAYFEIATGCAYFSDPEKFHNEIRFPTTQPKVPNGTTVWEDSAIRFELPDSLMRRIYPYTVDADDWTSCFGHRTSGVFLTLKAIKSKRFGNSCDPLPSAR